MAVHSPLPKFLLFNIWDTFPQNSIRNLKPKLCLSKKWCKIQYFNQFSWTQNKLLARGPVKWLQSNKRKQLFSYFWTIFVDFFLFVFVLWRRLQRSFEKMHLIMTKEAGKLLPNSYRFLRFILKLAKAGLLKASLQQCVWGRFLVGSGTWGLWD